MSAPLDPKEPVFLTHQPEDFCGNGDDLTSFAFDAGTLWQEFQDEKVIRGISAERAALLAEVTRLRAERDALAAQIEQVQACNKAWGWRGLDVILATTPADALKAVKAEARAVERERWVGQVHGLVAASEKATRDHEDHENYEIPGYWFIQFEELDRDCDGTYPINPPLIVLAEHLDDALNIASGLVIIPEGCMASGVLIERRATWAEILSTTTESEANHE